MGFVRPLFLYVAMYLGDNDFITVNYYNQELTLAIMILAQYEVYHDNTIKSVLWEVRGSNYT